MPNNSPDSLETLFGPYIARAADEINLTEHTMFRRYELESAGVPFPDPELENIFLLREAALARDRGWGQVVLHPDGSVLDPGDYDYRDSIEPMQQNKMALINAERLKKFIDLELTAKGLGLAATKLAERDGADSELAEAVGELTTIHKKIGQVLIKFDNWDAPWSAIMENEFPGESAEFPMSAAEIYATQYFLRRGNLYEKTRSDFHILLLAHNIRRELGISIAEQYGEERLDREEKLGSIGMAWATSLYVDHSPQGVSDFLDLFVTDSLDIDWLEESRKATKAAKRYTHGD